MARKLTLAQKKILDQHNVYMIEYLPKGVLEKLVALNDYETLYPDIDRYLGDKYRPSEGNRLREGRAF